MIFFAKAIAAFVIILLAVASASVLFDRLINGASYVRDAREKGKRL